MSIGRIEGIIRWSIMNPDLAIISHGNEDYFTSFMDLTTSTRPADGDRVVFTPQLMNGCLKARAVATKPVAVAQLRIVPAATALKVSFSSKPNPPVKTRCQSCQTLVTPRHMRLKKHGPFERICPKCQQPIDKKKQRC